MRTRPWSDCTVLERSCKRPRVWNFVFWRNIHGDHELRTLWKIVPHERALRAFRSQKLSISQLLLDRYRIKDDWRIIQFGQYLGVQISFLQSSKSSLEFPSNHVHEGDDWTILRDIHQALYLGFRVLYSETFRVLADYHNQRTLRKMVPSSSTCHPASAHSALRTSLWSACLGRQ